MKELPRTVDALIEELDSIYAHKTATPDEDIRTVMYRAGQRSVIDGLLSRKENEDMFYGILEED